MSSGASSVVAAMVASLMALTGSSSGGHLVHCSFGFTFNPFGVFHRTIHGVSRLNKLI